MNNVFQFNSKINATKRSVAELNDEFRKGIYFTTAASVNDGANQYVVTHGCREEFSSHENRMALMLAIANFSHFSEDNDPWLEHDFGSVTVNNQKIFWKIDYFNKVAKRVREPNGSIVVSFVPGNEASSNAADPAKTARVMTIMLASEY